MTFAVSLLLLALALGAGGCRGGDGKNGATATATAEATIEATGTTAPLETATPAPDIRQEDLSAQQGLQEFLTSSGGEVATNLITYVDLTEDGVDDAVVPVSSGGEGGDIAVFVFGYGPDGLGELLRLTPSMPITARFTDGALQIDEAQYAPGDPFCCPSQLQRTIYRWDGQQLAVASQETVPAAGN